MMTNTLTYVGELCFARSFDLKEPGDNHLKSLPTFMVDWTSLMYNVSPAEDMSIFDCPY